MGYRVVGVTVGPDKVRAAVIETRLRRFELKAVHEVSRRAEGVPAWEGAESDDIPKETPAAALAKALVPPLSAMDSVVLAYPGERAFIRRLSFPFKEKVRINATLPFQMIGHVPVEPEDIHCAYGRIGVDGANTDTLAVAVPINEFAEFLSQSKAMGFDPASVSVEGICLAALGKYLPDAIDGQLLIWAEGTHTEIVVLRGEEPVVVRTVELGEAVCKDGETSSAFSREVVLSIASASEFGASVGHVWVAGPEADVLADSLGEALKLPCEVLNPRDLTIPGAAGLGDAPSSFIKVIALALTSVTPEGAGSLDLRTGPFKVEGNHGLFREHAGFFAITLILFALLGLANGVFKYAGLIAEKEANQAELVAYTTRILGKEQTDFDAVLRTVKSVAGESFKVFPTWTGVDTLNRLSSMIMDIGKVSTESDISEAMEDLGISAGQPYAVEFEQVRIEPRSASIRGEVATIEIFDDFVDRLKADPCFHDVVVESTERIRFQRHQGWQRFSVRMTVDCQAKTAQAKQGAK
ncbi:MAG: hypothetical protein ACOX51_10650 [Myxococcota bacterium]|jgi:Tfp pilus assembly PilM family ATPase